MKEHLLTFAMKFKFTARRSNAHTYNVLAFANMHLFHFTYFWRSQSRQNRIRLIFVLYCFCCGKMYAQFFHD